MLRRSFSLAILLVFGISGARAQQAPLGCEPMGSVRPVCKFQGPEDLAALPGGKALLVSEFALLDPKRGLGISLYLPATDQVKRLFPVAEAPERSTPGWGDESCLPPSGSDFHPHGIDLAPRPDGKLALAVIQHGGRESIEFFEVLGADSDWRLQWRGCLMAPPGSWLNDVLLLADGSLLASHMMSREFSIDALKEGQEETGYVLHWSRQAGYQEVPGTRAVVANGIEVSEDERKLFLNTTFEGSVRRIDRATGYLEAEARVQSPDNSTWAPGGKLLVASVGWEPLEGPIDCHGTGEETCQVAFRIVAVDPQSMKTEVIYESDGRPMGGGTVGLQLGEELFMGSFAGNRLVRLALPH